MGIAVINDRGVSDEAAVSSDLTSTSYDPRKEGVTHTIARIVRREKRV